ncbi:ribulose-phosphate 3-epimerase [Carboxydothermus islandicus]|uniref:Ribulose-phosphate 3-epimerase n=1 Tax=Carboxydothermus islandicus TaxID=661089 RepID=A0A1L8D1I2_9THEO|nr:ribulose-phosphate 3-epimerase [Carboxydothermus islandicus]
MTKGAVNLLVNIAPSILNADFSNLEFILKQLEAGGVKYLHLDIMDGHFVPNLTFGPPVVKSLRAKTNLIFDVHLMVEKPESLIEPFIEAGADMITIHWESTQHPHRLLQKIKDTGKKAGIALNPATPPENLEYLLDLVDLILIMSVNPGFGGQSFINNQLTKIKKVKSLVCKASQEILLGVDGGINLQTAPLVIGAGANFLVTGSFLFKGDVIKNLKDLIAVCQKS